MHYINEQEIRSLISMNDIIDTIEAYYLKDGEKKVHCSQNDYSSMMVKIRLC